jgi:ribokinase
MRCAVVGHVEWAEFVRVPRMPAAGEIVHADGYLAEPAGGGAVVARQLALLADGCTFFTVLGDDEFGRRSEVRLRELGIDVRPAWSDVTRRAWVHTDAAGERSITVLGDKLLPRGPLPLDDYDAFFFVAGDVEALRSARRAPFLAATPRELPTLRAASVRLDLLVGSATDPGERYDGSLDVGVTVLTEGAAGGTANGDRFRVQPFAGEIGDTYGAGDSFAATLAFALARGDDLEAAVALAAQAGASVLAGRGPYATQLALGG